MNGIVFFDPKCKSNKAQISGTIKLHQCNPKFPTVIIINLKGFKRNKEHAIHIHEYGNISEGCMSSGGHYNPYNKKHGSYTFDGNNRHAGDLVNNITSNNKGEVKLKFSDNLVDLFGEESVIGRTIVIHSGIDDLGRGGMKNGKIVDKKVHAQSLKTGNAGGRMSCAIIGRDKKGGC